MNATPNLHRQLSRIVRQCLAEGARVEIDGLGTFVPGQGRHFRFIPQKKPRIFIAYASEDLEAVKKIYAGLKAHGFCPWLDRKKLLPGQNWPRAIEAAIESSDYFVACFSRRSVMKHGTFQTELRFAIDCASRVPADDIFLIPVRLDDCELPRWMARRLQYLNMFPDWKAGLQRLVKALSKQETERAKRV